MIEVSLVLGLLVLIIISQQIYYGLMLNKLINKFMSRNYGEYEASKPVKENIKLKIDPGIPEDLSYLNNIDPRMNGLR